MKGKSGIYRIVNLRSGRGYVGQAQCFARRRTVHFSMLRRGVHFNRWLQRAWNKHQEDAFRFVILEECSKEQLTEREQFWIDSGKGQYNLSQKVGAPGARKWTNAQKKAQSRRLRGNKHLLGHQHSDETRAAIGAAGKGRVPSELCRELARQRMIERNRNNPPRRGKVCSDEHRRKVSEARRNHDRDQGAECQPGTSGDVVPVGAAGDSAEVTQR